MAAVRQLRNLHRVQILRTPKGRPYTVMIHIVSECRVDVGIDPYTEFSRLSRVLHIMYRDRRFLRMRAAVLIQLPSFGRTENNMRNDINILIAGGDMRQVYCAARLAQRYGTAITGFDSSALPSAVRALADPLPAADSYDCAVLPVLALDENGDISASFYSGSLSAETVASAVRDGGIIFTGRGDSRLAELFPQHRLISYLGREELQLRNAVLTAEGAVQLALERLDVALNGLPVLIVGLGRIGTALALILRGFGADITAAVRSSQAEAKARMLGVKSVRTDALGGDYTLVFNTAPAEVFTPDNIGRFRDDTLFIELASDAGGFSTEAAEALGARLIRANGLPGKTAPVTAGEIIADAVAAIIEEGGGGYEN